MILLVSLMLLTLFLLLGTTYILTAGARRPCTISDALAKATRRLAEEVSRDPPLCGGPPLPTVTRPFPYPTINDDVDQWHRNCTRARAVNRYLMASLLNDKHGDLYRRGTVNPSFVPLIALANPSGTTYPNFYSITVELEEKAATPPAGVKATYEPYEGRILTFVDDDEPNAAFRIVSGKSVGGTNPERWRFLAHPVNHLAHPDISVINTKAGSNDPMLRPSVVILGREFSGDSDGTSDDLHESWDAPDDRNIFLAWVQEEAVLGRDGIPDPATAGSIGKDAPEKPWRYVIPSYHRPDRLLAELQPLKSGTMTAAGINDFLRTLAARWTGDNGTQQEVASRTTLLHLRPMGKMEFHPDEDEQVSPPGVLSGRLSKSWTRAGFPSRPAWQTVDPNPTADGIRANSIYEQPEHPDFTGSNVTIINGQKYYFDPINGPWDVDNDGDGVQDSVWIDVGAPEIVINNQRCRPLVAMMILDLDSRVNVNVHGSLAERDHGITQTNVPAAATGVRYAGLASTAAAPLPAGLGWGPADVNPRAVLARGYPEAGASAAHGLVSASLNRLTNLFVGIDSSASERTPRDFLIPTVPAEGRYGDSVNLPNALTPSPGKRGVLDPPIDDPSAPQRLRYPPARFGDASVPLGAPVDPWATTRVGLDQMGQPYFSRHPVGSTPWQQDRVDTPYDLSVGTNAPKPGWAYDPDVTLTGVINYQDNLYTPSQLERLLRLFEPGVETVSPRLLSLLGRDAEKARLTVTTESWDSAAACVPWPVLHPLLTLSDQADRTKPSLLSWDLQMGLRMDVNRPFGDGVDNNGNGVIDEPAEAVFELDTQDAYGLAGTQFKWQALTNGRDVDDDPSGTVDIADQQLARQLYARHLFVLAMRAVSGLQLPSNKLADYRREAAQWAVNVVDFRDTDSIMTRFEYPKNFSPTSTTWDTFYADPDEKKANVGVAWGCERPELLLTETLAWRNIQERGPPTSLTYADEGTGGLVVEVYHPWTSMTSDSSVRGNAIPGEFAANPGSRYASGVDGAIDLAKRNTDGQPVFQLLVVDDSEDNERSMLEKPEWPAPSAGEVKALVYMGADGPVDEDGKPFDGANASTPRWALHQGGGSTTTLRPGQFGLIAGPRASENQKMLPILSQSGQQEGLTFHPAERRFGLEVPDGTPRTLPEFVVTPLATTKPPFRKPFEYAPNGSVRRVAGGLYPKDAPTISPPTAAEPLNGPIGALVMVTKPTDQNAILTLPTTLPTADVPGLIAAFSKRHRILLRRLANPLAKYHADDNPYLTIDSIAVQDQGVIMDNPDDPAQPKSRGRLRTIERCSAQKPVAGEKPDTIKPLVNNLWKQDSKAESDQPAWEDPAEPYTYRAAPNCFRRTVRPEGSVDSNLRTLEGSLGFLPPALRIPVPSSDGDPPVPHVPPFPWLTWLNRDFASAHELLLVPKSSPSRLTRDHTEKWPFHHLFFGGGRMIPLGDPAEPTDPAIDRIDGSVWSARVGIFEFLRVVDRFADAEQRVAALDAVELSNASRSMGGCPLLLPPHNYLSHFREPGRINLNTITSADVWTAVARPDSPVPYDDEIHYESAAPVAGLKPVDSFVPSEDWALVSDEDARQPESGNWSLDPSEDDGTSPNGALDLNHDANNDGQQAITGSMAHVRSLMVSRRGWALGDPSKQTIAGHFDRVLNREGAAQGQRWFSGIFKSAWARTTANEDLHSPTESTLMRPSSDAFVRLSRETGYGRLRHSDIALIPGIQYVCRIDVRGDFSPGQNDHIPELWRKNTTDVYLPSSSSRTYSPATNTTTIVAHLTVPPSGSVQSITCHLSLALWSATSIDIRGVSLKAPDGRELLGNGTFSQGLDRWSADGGKIKLHGSPTLLFTRTLGLPEHPDGAAQLGRDYADPLRHPHFLYQDIVRLSNLVTPRSNVFAVWMTVGFFELDDRDRLGAEYGLDNGSAIRHKAFQIIDRSIPVGYEPNGAFEGNARNTILHYHFTN